MLNIKPKYGDNNSAVVHDDLHAPTAPKHGSATSGW
jgi:hypothetical protein